MDNNFKLPSSKIETFVWAEGDNPDVAIDNCSCLTINKSGSRNSSLSFCFDHCSVDRANIELSLVDALSQAHTMGINSNLIIANSAKSALDDCDVLDKVVNGLVLSSLGQFKSSSYSIQCSVFEVSSGSKLRDLFGQLRSSKQPQQPQQKESLSSWLSKLHTEEYTNDTSRLMEDIRKAMIYRMWLINLVHTRKMEGQQLIYNASPVGPIGNVFFRVRINQLFELTDAATASSTHSTHINRSTDFCCILLCTTDTLTFRPANKSDTLILMPKCNIEESTYKMEAEDPKKLVAKLGLLSNGLLSLSTLSRVAQLLRQCQQQSGRSNMHIPFRETMLTRLLKEPLQGTSKTHFLLVVTKNQLLDNTIHSLRFAADLANVETSVKPGYLDIAINRNSSNHRIIRIDLLRMLEQASRKTQEEKLSNTARCVDDISNSEGVRTLCILSDEKSERQEHDQLQFRQDIEFVATKNSDIAATAVGDGSRNDTSFDEGSKEVVLVATNIETVIEYTTNISQLSPNVEFLQLMDNFNIELQQLKQMTDSLYSYQPVDFRAVEAEGMVLLPRELLRRYGAVVVVAGEQELGFAQNQHTPDPDADDNGDDIEFAIAGIDENDGSESSISYRSDAITGTTEMENISSLISEQAHASNADFENLPSPSNSSSSISVEQFNEASAEAITAGSKTSQDLDLPRTLSTLKVGNRRPSSNPQLSTTSSINILGPKARSSSLRATSQMNSVTVSAKTTLPSSSTKSMKSMKGDSRAIGWSSSAAASSSSSLPSTPSSGIHKLPIAIDYSAIDSSTAGSNDNRSISKSSSSSGSSSHSSKSANLNNSNIKPTDNSITRTIHSNSNYSSRKSTHGGSNKTNNSHVNGNVSSPLSVNASTISIAASSAPTKTLASTPSPLGKSSSVKLPSIGGSGDGNSKHQSLSLKLFPSISNSSVDSTISESQPQIQKSRSLLVPLSSPSNGDNEIRANTSSSSMTRDRCSSDNSQDNDSDESRDVEDGEENEGETTTFLFPSPNKRLMDTNSTADMRLTTAVITIENQDRERQASYSVYSSTVSAAGTANLSTEFTTVRKIRGSNSVRDDSQVDEGEDKGCSLLEIERYFLRNVQLNKVNEAKENLRKGANVNAINSFGRTAMMIAARNGCVPMLSMLLQHGGSLSCRGSKGETLLHLAANNDQLLAVQWLHEAGIVGNSVDLFGQTAAHIAARRIDVRVLHYLHEHMRLDMSQEDFDGRSPLDCIPRFCQHQQSPEDREICKKYILFATGVSESNPMADQNESIG